MSRKKENKRPDGLYEVKAIIGRSYDGKPLYKSFYSKKSKTDARNKAEAYKAELQSKYDPAVLFGVYAEDFLTRAKTRVKITSYETGYRLPLTLHIIPRFGKIRISDIRKSDIERYAADMLKDHKPSTVCAHIRVLSALFNDAIDNAVVSVNPCKNIRIKKPQKNMKRVYSPVQAELVLKFCKGDPFGLHVHMLLSYGMSLSEYLGIMIEDIDFENLTVSINKGAVLAPAKSPQFMIVSEPKNAHRNRQIAITKETADWLKTCSHKYISNSESDDVMKSTVFRYAYKAFMRRMHDHYMQDNIDIPMLNPHELRHSRASLWVNEGRSLFAIAEMLGWSDLKMLRSVYGHPDIQELRKNLNL